MSHSPEASLIPNAAPLAGDFADDLTELPDLEDGFRDRRDGFRDRGTHSSDRERVTTPGSSASSILSNEQPARELVNDQNSQHYNSIRQANAVFWHLIVYWVLTVLLLGLFIVALRVYQTKSPLTKNQTTTFNGLITAIGLLLALNFFEAFKDIAKVVRWRLLADRAHSPRQIDLVLGLSSLKNTALLILELPARPILGLFCIVLILLNLSFPTVVGLSSLLYSVEGGHNLNDTYIVSGDIQAADLSCYMVSQQGSRACAQSDEIKQATAHSFGDQALSTNCCPYSDLGEVFASRNDCSYYCKRSPEEEQEFAYRFLEYNTRDAQHSYPSLTNRVITASSGQCNSYGISHAYEGPDSSIVYEYTDGENGGNITIPAIFSPADSTTYIYRGSQTPETEEQFGCGPRCMQIWVHKTPGEGGGWDEKGIYSCDVTVNVVGNVTDEDTQNISDDLARLSASAIALQGRSTPVNDDQKTWTQYQMYPFNAPLDIHFKNVSVIGANIAEFAIGSLATLATRNTEITSGGASPQLGNTLHISWWWTIGWAIALAGAHFAVLSLAVSATRAVVVANDSSLAEARLLKDLLNPLGLSGTFLKGREISRAVENYIGANAVVYGPRPIGSEGYVLEINKGVRPKAQWAGNRHPDGLYL